jgi:hypothetical protein
MAPQEPDSSVAQSSHEPVWKFPDTWKEQGAGGRPSRTFIITNSAGAKATASIISFPGQAGGVLANVNRWRGQIGLPPVAESDLANIIETFQAGNATATVVDLASSNKAIRLIAIIAPVGDATWFYKLHGDNAVVGGEKDNLINVVRGARHP